MEAAARRRQGHVHATTTASARPRPSASSTGATPANNDFLAVTQFWVVGPLHTRRCDIVCFVNGIPLVLLELKASHKSVEHAYDEEPARLPRHDPAAVHAERARDPLERLGDEGRRDVRAVGALRRVEADRRRGGAGRRLARDGDPRHCASRRGCSTSSRTSSPTSSGPAAWSRCSRRTTRSSASTRRSRALRDRAHARGPARRLLAHAGLRQEPLDAVLHAEGAAPRARQLDLRDGHRPRGARRPALRRVQGRRASSRATSRPTSSAHLRRAARRGPPLRLHADPQVPPRAGRARCRSARTATTSSSSPTRRTARQYDDARAEHAPGAAERELPRLHRHAADRRRGASARARSSATTSRSTTSATRSRTARRSRSSTRTGSPSCRSSTSASTRSSTEILEEAELDDAAGAGARRGASRREYQLITRPERLRADRRRPRPPLRRPRLPRQGDVRRDRQGDRGAHVRPRRRGVGRAPRRAARAERDALPALERAGVDEQIAFMRDDRHGGRRLASRRTRSPTCEALGLDITPAPQADARRGPRRALQGPGRPVPARLRLRDVDDRLRRAVLLDDLPRSADAQPHADADDRPREPRLPREGERADRRLRRRLPPTSRRRSRSTRAATGDEPASTSSATSRRWSASSRRSSPSCVEFCERWDVDLDALARADGFEFIALRDASVEALLVDDVTRRGVPRALGRGAAAVRGDPARPGGGAARAASSASRATSPRRSARSTSRPTSRTSPAPSSELLDRSVGAEEYVIRAAAEGADADALIDLNAIDFDALAARLAGQEALRGPAARRRSSATSVDGAARGATRPGSISSSGSRELIDEYNAGSLNVDEMLRRLQSLSRELSEEEQRTVARGPDRAGARRLRPADQARPGADRRGARRRSRRSPAS